jgi:hypothetical protein
MTRNFGIVAIVVVLLLLVGYVVGYFATSELWESNDPDAQLFAVRMFRTSTMATIYGPAVSIESWIRGVHIFVLSDYHDPPIQNDPFG